MALQVIIKTTKDISLREKCPNTKFFLDRIFPHLDWIPRDTTYLSVFNPNVGKYDQKKLDIWELFTQWLYQRLIISFHPSAAFHIETCNLVFIANQMVGFYIYFNTRMKQV